jgi:hypothetical protein
MMTTIKIVIIHTIKNLLQIWKGHWLSTHIIFIVVTVLSSSWITVGISTPFLNQSSHSGQQTSVSNIQGAAEINPTYKGQYMHYVVFISAAPCTLTEKGNCISTVQL